ncbi:MAG: 2-oxoacid:acceptor oxidoreductase subunit alpha [Candidatus Hydrogenedentota bacterium]
MTPAVSVAEYNTIGTGRRTTVNNVVLNVATKNGSGSQSANLILLRSIFAMGIPVAGKNLFPSNIEGLPTWFIIRASEEGWLGARERTDIDVMVCMNDSTAEEDLSSLRSGATVVLNDSLKRFVTRDDLEVFTVPFNKLVTQVSDNTRLRKKIVNVIYVGVLARMLGIEMDAVLEAIDQQFGTKPKAAKMNQDAAQAGYAWASENLDEQFRVRFERREAAKGKVIIEGNEAIAMGMLMGGATVVAWYPITPSSSVCEYLTDYMAKFRHDPVTGQATYAIVQAEDEIASIGMVLGAGWTGARSFTATSGPGISLMSEMAGLSYFAEVPAVIVDIQRMGPSTGLPTRTAQGDIMKAYMLSHGDCKHVLLIPGTMRECYEFAMEALDLAQELQTLVFVMSDLDLGMNKWMADPFDPPSKPIRRGKVLNKDELERRGEFNRYADIDGDGIPYRTLPGTAHPKAAFFTRGTGHTASAGYSERPQDWKANIDRLAKKFETARTMTPPPIVERVEGARVGVIAYGSTEPAVREALHLLRTEREFSPSYLRMRALPFHPAVRQFIEDHSVIYVIDQNRDAQMATVLRGELPELAPKVRSVRHYDGMPIYAQTIIDQILAQEG